MYSPLIGQFAQRDPLGYAAGDDNLYRYCLNEPTDGTDPSGMAALNLPNLEGLLGKSAIIGGAILAKLKQVLYDPTGALSSVTKLESYLTPGAEPSSFDLPFVISRSLKLGTDVGFDLHGIVQLVRNNDKECWILGAARAAASKSQDLNKFSGIAKLLKAPAPDKVNVPGVPANGEPYYSATIPVTLSVSATNNQGGQQANLFNAGLTFTVTWDTRKKPPVVTKWSATVDAKPLADLLNNLPARVQNGIATAVNGLGATLKGAESEIGLLGASLREDALAIKASNAAISNRLNQATQNFYGTIVGAYGSIPNAPGAAGAAQLSEGLAAQAHESGILADRSRLESNLHVLNALADVKAMTPNQLALFNALNNNNVRDLVNAVVDQIRAIADSNLHLEVRGTANFEFAQIVKK